MRIAIVGKGKVGRALAAAIMFSGRDTVSALVSARTKLKLKLQADVLIIATRDDAIETTAVRALEACTTQPKLIAHLAGSLPSTILPNRKGLARITLHPIQSFALPDRELFKGISWMVSTSDAVAIAWAQKFVRSIGSSGTFELPADSLSLYHAMTAMSANFITLLTAGVEEIAEAMGRNPIRIKRSLAPLMTAALQNALTNDALSVLTGPIKRRDMETIKKHQAALQKASPDLRKIYDAFLNYGLKR